MIDPRKSSRVFSSFTGGKERESTFPTSECDPHGLDCCLNIDRASESRCGVENSSVAELSVIVVDLDFIRRSI
jgi:hypothetical protein